MMGRDLTNTTRKTRRREPAGFKTSSTSRRELIPRLCSRFATVDEQTAALAAAAVLRSAQKRSDFRPFTAANPCRA
jgi:hypothetical protein